MTVPGLKLDPRSSVAVYRQIADGIRTAIRDGRVLPGQQLPPTRELAEQLGVNRNTVVAAYDLLIDDGTVSGHTGRGTFVAASAASPGPADGAWFGSFSRALQSAAAANLQAHYRAAMSSEGISFAGSYPAADLLPVDEFRRAMTTALRERGAEILSYGPTAGYAPLRAEIAAGMRARGSRVSADDLVITNGSQQAIEIVLRAFVDPGDAVVVEDPTYTGALGVLGALGARLVGVPTDADGVRVDLLARALERHRPRVMYLQPTFHNPTARVLSEPRRREVVELAARHACVVVEDDWAGDLRFEGDDLPTLHALDGGRHVVYLSTFSKKLIPGIRVGWVAARAAVRDRLLTIKQVEDHGTSLVLQAALHAFLENGSLEPHLAKVRSAYLARRDAMLAALDRRFPATARWSRPQGGLFVWVELPPGIDSGELAVDAQRHGVSIGPGALFQVDGRGSGAMRLSFASTAPERIEQGIAVLGRWVCDRSVAHAAAREDHDAVPVL